MFIDTNVLVSTDSPGVECELRLVPTKHHRTLFTNLRKYGLEEKEEN